MITNNEHGSAAVFGNGTLEVNIGENDKMGHLPYILINEWSESQNIGLWNEGDKITGKATGKKIYLQFMNRASFEVFDEAVGKIREMLKKNDCIDCGQPLTFYPAISCYSCDCGNVGMGSAR